MSFISPGQDLIPLKPWPNSFYLLQEDPNWHRALLLLPWEAAAGCFHGEPGMRDGPVPEWAVLDRFPQLFKWGNSAAGRSCSVERLQQAEELPGGCLELPLNHPDLPWSQHRGINWVLSMSGLEKMGKRLQWELLVLVLHFCASERPRNPSLYHEEVSLSLSQVLPHPIPSFTAWNENSKPWFFFFFFLLGVKDMWF